MEYVKSILITDKTEYEKDRARLLELLQKVRIPNIIRNRRDASGNVIGRQRENVIGTIGRTCNFGLVRSRRFGYINSRHTTKWSDLHNALFKFGNHVCPAGMDVTSVTLNHNVKAKKHIDGFNVGDSVIVGVGTYEGGKLRVYENDNFTAFDICDRPLMFNGAKYAHETEDFTGDRYTIIYYSQRPKTKPWTSLTTLVGTGISQNIPIHRDEL
jgi:hypothetical protein